MAEPEERVELQAMAYKHYTWEGGGATTFKVYAEPEPGKPGVEGAQGCAVIYWDKEG